MARKKKATKEPQIIEVSKHLSLSGKIQVYDYEPIDASTGMSIKVAAEGMTLDEVEAWIKKELTERVHEDFENQVKEGVFLWDRLRNEALDELADEVEDT